MSRVDERQQAERVQEQKRVDTQLQKQRDAQKGQEFARVVEQKRGELGQAARQESAASARRAALPQAVSAREHAAAKQFHALLEKRGDDSAEQFGKAQKTGDNKVRQESDESRSDAHGVARRSDAQQDHLEAISRDDPRHEQPGDGDQGSGAHQDGGAFQGQKGETQWAAQPALVKAAAGPLPSPQAQLVEQLVKRMLVGIGPDGLAEVHCEFQTGVLAGAWMKVSAQGGQISVSIRCGEESTRRLLKASHHDLSVALKKHALTLAEFDVAA
jgi:hypothetical protein